MAAKDQDGRSFVTHFTIKNWGTTMMKYKDNFPIRKILLKSSVILRGFWAPTFPRLNLVKPPNYSRYELFRLCQKEIGCNHLLMSFTKWSWPMNLYDIWSVLYQSNDGNYLFALSWIEFNKMHVQAISLIHSWPGWKYIIPINDDR